MVSTADAARTEGAAEPVALHRVLRAVPSDELARVLWAGTVDVAAVAADLARIADDILNGRPNSLSPEK